MLVAIALGTAALMPDKSQDRLSPAAPPPWFNAPNSLAAIRLIGAGVLVAFAWHENPHAFLGLAIFLLLTDWIDGKLARWLGQQTAFGAKLDTFADIALYASLVIGLAKLEPAPLFNAWPWIVAAGGSYAASVLASIMKFKCWPSYHTRGAKIAWSLASVAAICLLVDGPTWPLRAAAAFVVMVNAEAIAITAALDQPRNDVPSLMHARRRRSGPPDS